MVLRRDFSNIVGLPPPKSFSWVLLVFCSFWIFLTRLHTFHEPLERDISTYAVIGHELLQGRRLYSDLWDQKPPAIYITFALAELIGGYGPESIFLINVFATLLVLFGIYKAGSVFGEASGRWAALFWTLISGDLYLQGNQPNTELFINACMAWAFGIQAAASNRQLQRREAVAIGLLFSWATSYKQVMVAPSALFLTAYLIFSTSVVDLRARLKTAALIVLLGIAPWLLAAGYFGLRGQFPAFYDAVFRFNFYYASIGLQTPLHPNPLNWRRFLRTTGPVVYSPMLLLFNLVSSLFFLIALKTKHWKESLLGLFFLGGSFIAVVLQGHLFAHYFQMLLPPLLIGTGWAISFMYSSIRWKPYALLLAGGLTLAAVLYEVPSYRLPPEEWCRRKYGERFTWLPDVGNQINHLLLPQETFYNWGSDSGLYFVTKRDPPSGVLPYGGLVQGPLVDSLSRRVIQDLDRTRPELLVVSKYMIPRDRPFIPLVPWLLDHYKAMPSGADRGAVVFWIRRGGRLDRNSSTVPR